MQSFSDATHNAFSEIVLIGSIMKNIELMSEYDGILSVDDFKDESIRSIFRILQSYYAIYGSEELEQTHYNLIVAKLIEESDVSLRYINLKKPWTDVQKIRKCGALQPADNEAFRDVKRCSTLRQLQSAGFDIKEICEHPDLKTFTSDDVVKMVYEKLDPVFNAASLHPREDFSSNIMERALRFFENPEIGLQTPFSFINEHMHGLCPNDFTLIGGLSNTGKGRFLMNLLVWLVAKEGQTVCLLSNEMTSEDFFKAMVCTIINNPELHDKNLRLTQTNIVQSRFKDAQGEYVERLPDETGMEFHARVVEESAECRDYEAVLKWWEETFPGKLIFKSVASDYSTPRLKQEIRRAKACGCTVVAYDTLKGYQSTEWGALVQATTDLSEMIKSDKEGLIGLATFQLTDDVAMIKPEKLTSMNIARAKGIMHLADNILMFMPLRNDLKDEYVVVSNEVTDEDDKPIVSAIDEDVSVIAFRIIKNRRGGGKEQIYAVQNNLDTNRWIYIGELVREASVKVDWSEWAVS